MQVLQAVKKKPILQQLLLKLHTQYPLLGYQVNLHLIQKLQLELEHVHQSILKQVQVLKRARHPVHQVLHRQGINPLPALYLLLQPCLTQVPNHHRIAPQVLEVHLKHHLYQPHILQAIQEVHRPHLLPAHPVPQALLQFHLHLHPLLNHHLLRVLHRLQYPVPRNCQHPVLPL